MNTIWIIFSINEKEMFPSFVPIGIFSTRERAEEQIKRLPTTQQYQLFEMPIDEFFAEVTENGKVKNSIGKFNHYNYRNGELVDE